VWISIVILPAAFVGALHGTLHIFSAILPFGVLMLGLQRRSEAILLGLFPAAVLVPVAIQPTLASSHVYGPIRFALVALGVIAYLFGVSFFTTFHEPPAPRSVRGLSSAQLGPPARWRRRERVYWILTTMCLIIPAFLIAWVSYDDGIADYLGRMYPGRVALMTTALAVGAIVLWLIIFHYAFLGVLRPHRTGDRDLVTALAQARADAKSGKPRGRFYLAVALALVAMMGLLLLRHL
jgi:predicted membrane channel-forming protein YqfA (hemolysin III family)